VNLSVVGCTHQTSSLDVRERLAFQPDQIAHALDRLHREFPQTEAVLLSTCNRVEVYTAHEHLESAPTHEEVAQFLAEFHGLPLESFFNDLFEHTGPDAVRHLFQVVASLGSMVVGEPQITAQVKQAYQSAQEHESAGPLLHALFQRAARVAKRVHTETALAQRRVSIPSVAVADYAKRVFDRFDDKQVLVIGAGEMGEETVRYLIDEGAKAFVVVNRSLERAERLAGQCDGRAVPWSQLEAALVEADLVVSTTAAAEPVIAYDAFCEVMRQRQNRPIFLLDLAVPRDIDPAIDRLENVYLYTIDELKEVCRANADRRRAEMHKALEIVDQETDDFMVELNHRATSPIIRRLRGQLQQIADAETDRLFRELPELDEPQREKIRQFRHRLLNKLLHPPLSALRDEARDGTPHSLLEALKRLFHLRD
jgi:glutamyl-tRNA reductase